MGIFLYCGHISVMPQFSLQSAPSPSFVLCLQVKSLCLSLQDSNVLVQRNMLEILLYFFPFAICLVGKHRFTDMFDS